MKVGLEVHQQLATGKLFCACPAELSEEVTGAFVASPPGLERGESSGWTRCRLPGRSGLPIRYESTPSNCLVEMDEEPPRPLNPAALDTALQLALLLGSRVVDEVEVMRKMVVDGSNTSGFQRTALIATGGHLE